MGKLGNVVSFHYTARSQKESKNDEYCDQTVNMTTKNTTVWQYRCINVLNVVKAKQTSAFVTFTLRRFFVQPQRDWWDVYDEYYIDHIYMGSQPHQTDEEGKNHEIIMDERCIYTIHFGSLNVPTWPRYPKYLFANVTADKLSTTGRYLIRIQPAGCGNVYPLLGISGLQLPILSDTTSLNVPQTLRDDRWPNTANSLVTRKQRQLRPPSGTIRLSFKGVPTARMFRQLIF
ncbi:hypothetical protein PHET_02995 [Paragonimus heterotremus]|uniref:Uncharacterized protein n=1 Tax=Paragonimus heterotremus TaxID=100268 RepID=A0A8J4X1Q9_9TREM|nr:hypothetical protein PHET_02995 [Paragonimus heterotremus]